MRLFAIVVFTLFTAMSTAEIAKSLKHIEQMMEPYNVPQTPHQAPAAR